MLAQPWRYFKPGVGFGRIRSGAVWELIDSEEMYTGAVRYLRDADPKLGEVIARVGKCTLRPRAEGCHFDYVVRAIVFQQLSTAAANTIYDRLLDAFGGRSPSPVELLGTPEGELRAVGLSGQKVRYVRDLAVRVLSGEVDIERLHELEDSAIVESLVRVTGVGVWTAQMFLIFRLGRPDVLPYLDLGVRKGVQRVYRLRTLPTPEQVQRIGRVWSPYSSVAAWYLWRSLEL